MNSQIVQSTPLYEQVYLVLREDILSGKIKTNEQINEVQLAKNMSISRGPVREAIRKLEHDGLLVRKNNNSLYVYKTSKADLKYIYECRQVLESLAVKLATKRVNDNELIKLERIINEKREILNDDTNPDISYDFSAKCTEFHAFILEKSGNPRLMQQTNQLRNLTRFYKKYKLRIKERRQSIFEEHFQIFNLIKVRNGDKASQVMVNHLKSDLQYLLQNIV